MPQRHNVDVIPVCVYQTVLWFKLYNRLLFTVYPILRNIVSSGSKDTVINRIRTMDILLVFRTIYGCRNSRLYYYMRQFFCYGVSLPLTGDTFCAHHFFNIKPTSYVL